MSEGCCFQLSCSFVTFAIACDLCSNMRLRIWESPETVNAVSVLTIKASHRCGTQCSTLCMLMGLQCTTTDSCMLTLQCACREDTCEQAAVLHYTYNRFEDLKSRRDRCDCAPTEDDAKRCFILPFDRSVSWLTWVGPVPLSHEALML